MLSNTRSAIQRPVLGSVGQGMQVVSEWHKKYCVWFEIHLSAPHRRIVWWFLWLPSLHCLLGSGLILLSQGDQDSYLEQTCIAYFFLSCKFVLKGAQINSFRTGVASQTRTVQGEELKKMVLFSVREHSNSSKWFHHQWKPASVEFKLSTFSITNENILCSPFILVQAACSAFVW